MSKLSRLEVLFGLASAAVLAGCGGGSVLRPAASGGAPPLGGSPIDPSAYFRIVRSKGSSLRRTSSIPAASVGGTAYHDSNTYTTTISDGAGNAVLYGADGSTILSYSTAAVAGGGGAATIASTLNDGSTFTTLLPPGSAFAANGVTTIGGITMNANAASGTCAATLVTDSGTVTVTSVMTADGLSVTLGDGTTGLVPNAMLVKAGLVTSGKARRVMDLSSPGCWAAIAILIAALAAIIAAFWYLGPIVAYIAAQITAAVQAGVAAGTISAGAAGINAILPAGAIFASLITALSAALAGSIVAIVNACAANNNAPRIGPQPQPPVGPPVQQRANVVAQ
ncbi:MAG TPA: hypothetical protein VIW69_03920 [Candidatus Elarobacter sp.]